MRKIFQIYKYLVSYLNQVPSYTCILLWTPTNHRATISQTKRERKIAIFLQLVTISEPYEGKQSLSLQILEEYFWVCSFRDFVISPQYEPFQYPTEQGSLSVSGHPQLYYTIWYLSSRTAAVTDLLDAGSKYSVLDLRKILYFVYVKYSLKYKSCSET